MSKSRCRSVCGAVGCWGLPRGSWSQLLSQAKLTFTVTIWAWGKDPAPTCETGSCESWDNTQLPLLSHRSVPPPLHRRLRFPCNSPHLKWFLLNMPDVLFCKGGRKTTCFFIHKFTAQPEALMWLQGFTFCCLLFSVFQLSLFGTMKYKHMKICWISYNSHVSLNWDECACSPYGFTFQMRVQ